jgi:DNA-binding FadR family transcriptional regulator
MASPIRQSRAAEIADDVQRYLASSGMHEGERFMTEAELADKYSVSRGIAREAVGRLRALGLLDSRQRKGIVVGRVDPVALVAQTLPCYSKSPRDLISLARLRYVLEIGSIELAVKNAAPEQIVELKQIAGKFAKLLGKRGSVIPANKLDLEFHRLLLNMTGEPLIAGMHQVLAEYFLLESQSAGTQIAVDDATCWEHTAIAHAVESRDVEQARALLRRHLRGVPELSE